MRFAIDLSFQYSSLYLYLYLYQKSFFMIPTGKFLMVVMRLKIFFSGIFERLSHLVAIMF